MLAPNLLAANFAQALKSLLPRGRVWPRDAGTIIEKVLLALSPTYERQTARANNLLVDAFPATTLELLPEWEATLGLPDPCAGPGPTIEARRQQVMARFTSTGGQSIAFYKAYAKQLGYDITIKNYAPFRAGMSRAGEACCSEDWFFVWSIGSALNTINYFRAGIGAAGEPLAYWGNAVLECEMNAVKPAHTTILFIYD